MNKAVNEKDWRDVVNEKIDSFSRDLESERDIRRELVAALECLNHSVKSLWDTLSKQDVLLLKLEKKIAELEGKARNTKRWKLW